MFCFNPNHTATLTFCIVVLLLTRIDFLVNNVFYSFGLSFSESWHQEYSILYFLAYQLAIFTLLMYTRNRKLFLFFQVFVLTSTQDLVYFGLWQGSFPAHQWVWTAEYKLFGFWNTATQTLLSILSVLFTLIVLRFGKVPVWIQSNPIADRFGDDSERLQKKPPSSK